ncbi:lysoplasmalogenase [Flavobacterium sp. RSB2_4_14]|uniref:lysoplasmalogenase n=1 Tax=Flavobacterium sp. RSB2_4_14 TaxID=3447665 RepID=UPI003F3E8D4E
MITSSNSLKGFLVFSFLYLAIVLFNFETISWFLKPFLIPFLFYTVLNSTPFTTKKWLLLALLFSWIGDCILLFADKGELYFIFGLVSFLIAHVLLITLFVKQKSSASHKQHKGFWIGFVLVLLYLFGMLFLLIPKLGELKMPVEIYAIIISLMLIETVKGVFNWNDKSKYLVLFGAVFFVTSDSILAFNKFYTPIPLASFWIMSTYLIAQFCITIGVLKMNETKS